jgi:hypothetical protein
MNSSSTKTSLMKQASPRLALHLLQFIEEPRCRPQVNVRSWRNQDLSSERRNLRFRARRGYGRNDRHWREAAVTPHPNPPGQRPAWGQIERGASAKSNRRSIRSRRASTRSRRWFTSARPMRTWPASASRPETRTLRLAISPDRRSNLAFTRENCSRRQSRTSPPCLPPVSPLITLGRRLDRQIMRWARPSREPADPLPSKTAFDHDKRRCRLSGWSERLSRQTLGVCL